MNTLVGRKREIEQLQRCLESPRSELVVIYGRRRVGKTFLVEETFADKFAFRYTGARGLTTRQQLDAFKTILSQTFKKSYPRFKRWLDAFEALKECLMGLPKGKKHIVFIDEMPWMDTGKSHFVSALEYFWNGWANAQRDVMLIATGSATTWMKDKLVSNKGGLHSRITCHIRLLPFSLNETEQYLYSLGMEWDRYQIAQAYMTLGGVPFYYSLLDPSLSLAQNIDMLFFSDGAGLRLEFDDLYTALFEHTEGYLSIVKLLSEHPKGMTQKDISTALDGGGGKLSRMLANLERCNIIEAWQQFGNKKKGTLYRLVDFYTLFYYKFVANNHTRNPYWWSNNLATKGISSWMGQTYELLCLCHHKQIKKALGLEVISTDFYTWRHRVDASDENSGAQVDMVIERADRTIHLCEIKFSEGTYDITKAYEKRLRERLGLFKAVTKTKKTVVHTFITTYGVIDGKHKSIVHSEVDLDALFLP